MTQRSFAGSTKFQVLQAIYNHWQKATFGPTVEEIRQSVGLGARSAVQWHINDLLADGLITNIPRRHRTVRLTEKGESLIELMYGDE